MTKREYDVKFSRLSKNQKGLFLLENSMTTEGKILKLSTLRRTFICFWIIIAFWLLSISFKSFCVQFGQYIFSQPTPCSLLSLFGCLGNWGTKMVKICWSNSFVHNIELLSLENTVRCEVGALAISMLAHSLGPGEYQEFPAYLWVGDLGKLE